MPLVPAITKDSPGTADLRRGAVRHEKTERAMQFLLYSGRRIGSSPVDGGGGGREQSEYGSCNGGGPCGAHVMGGPKCGNELSSLSQDS